MKNSPETPKKRDGIPADVIGDAFGHLGLPGLIIGIAWFLLTLLFGMISLVRKTDEINDSYKNKPADA